MRRLLLVSLGFAAGPAFGAGLQLMPGQWQFVGRVTHAEIPGAPPAMLRMMMQKPTSLSMCITPEQAARDPRSVFAKTQGRCDYKNFQMSGGKLAMVMSCRQADGGTMDVTTTGTYSPTGYKTHSTMMSNGARGRMTMVTDGIGKRLGPCSK